MLTQTGRCLLAYSTKPCNPSNRLKRLNYEVFIEIYMDQHQRLHVLRQEFEPVKANNVRFS